MQLIGKSAKYLRLGVINFPMSISMYMFNCCTCGTCPPPNLCLGSGCSCQTCPTPILAPTPAPPPAPLIRPSSSDHAHLTGLPATATPTPVPAPAPTTPSTAPATPTRPNETSTTITYVHHTYHCGGHVTPAWTPITMRYTPNVVYTPIPQSQCVESGSSCCSSCCSN
ncbi:hypothetical protein DFH05DRAFT_632117 [Lentinula detonsa]|uniref:Uncharacterized protein n=1 Tax=Lentinula detonsa TaxID=2804962 RepID=A0A9W8U1F6_9AGAR|nr:hypothetical protein DFH05DRAFT_632117 [Lentinula detonsa]